MKWNSPRKFFPPQVRAIRQSGEGIGKIESAWKPRTQKLGKSLLPGDIDRRTTFTKGECLSTLFSPFIRVRGQAFENRERYIRPQRVCTYTCIESRCIRHAALLILVALLACLLACLESSETCCSLMARTRSLNVRWFFFPLLAPPLHF